MKQQATLNHAPDGELKSLFVRDLRRRWKPVKEGEAAAPEHEAVRIRLHRCFSWMQRIEDLAAAGLDADDARLVYGWIAMNSLYGRWDQERKEPVTDRESLATFLHRLFKHDHDDVLGATVKAHRKLAESIVGDEFLNKHFWREGDENSIRSVQRAMYRLRSEIGDGKCHKALASTLDRVYLARCQLVHGAATFEGKLNRTAVRRCARFMEIALPAITTVIIDHAWEEDWGNLCYPPSS
ncbi:MAG: hypothetical protein EA376_04885 [Phycisphaeraceae bacterium]|nr:MAG: hypothetical protein EA376_04885 [Phycisphaeraceae bacterium]